MAKEYRNKFEIKQNNKIARILLNGEELHGVRSYNINRTVGKPTCITIEFYADELTISSLEDEKDKV